MKVYVAKEYGAQNSHEVFDSFITGLRENNVHLVSSYRDADVVVIWSFLFSGRMAGNRSLYEHAKVKGIPVIVLEVGAIQRGVTWKVGINGINNTATWCAPFQKDRAKTLNIEVSPWIKMNQPWRDFVTILTQRPDSQQWVGKPSIEKYVQHCITQVRESTLKHSGIVIRPHPRDKITDFSFLNDLGKDVYFDTPHAYTDTYDSFDHDRIFRRSKLIFNYSSGPSIQSALEGIPVVCSEESLAWDVSVQDLNNITFPDRNEWLDRLAHTEWTTEEMKTGIVWNNLKHYL